MRKQHTPEERLAFKAKVEQAQEQMLTDLAENWRRKPEDLAEYLHFAGRFHQYSPRNAALIYAQNPAARFCGSYLFFKERGYYVRKGEQGMTVRVYTPVTFYRTRPDAEWRRLSHASAEMQRMVKAGAYETREQAFFKYGYVFDIGQTTCPKEDYPKLLGVGYDSEEHAAIYTQVVHYCRSIGMTFRIDHAARWVYPLAFRQDSEGVYREVGSGRDTALTQRRQLNERLIQWLHRIEDKGYTVVDLQQETEMAYRLKDGYLSLHYNTDGDTAFRFYDLGYRLLSSGIVEARGTLADAANRLVADRDQVLTGYDRVDYAALQVCAAQEERAVRQKTALSPQQRQLLVQSIKEGTAWLSKQNPSMSVELLMAGGQAIGFETLQRAGLQPDPALLQPLGEWGREVLAGFITYGFQMVFYEVGLVLLARGMGRVGYVFSVQAILSGGSDLLVGLVLLLGVGTVPMALHRWGRANQSTGGLGRAAGMAVNVGLSAARLFV